MGLNLHMRMIGLVARGEGEKMMTPEMPDGIVLPALLISLVAVVFDGGLFGVMAHIQTSAISVVATIIQAAWVTAFFVYAIETIVASRSQRRRRRLSWPA